MSEHRHARCSALPLPARASPSFLNGVARVFELSLGEMLWSRRTIFMALVVGAPVLLALVARVVAVDAASRRCGSTACGSTPPRMFGMMIWCAVPAVHRAGARRVLRHVADCRRGRGQDHHLPVHAADPRAARCCWASTSPTSSARRWSCCRSVMIVYFLLVPFGEIAGSFAALLTDLGLLALGLAAYGALFALVGHGDEAAAGGRAGVRLRLGAAGPGHARLSQAVHRWRTTSRRWCRTRCPRTASCRCCSRLQRIASAAVCLFWLVAALWCRWLWPRGPWNGANTSSDSDRRARGWWGPEHRAHYLV